MKITITADAFAITSSIKKEEYDLVKKHNPSALKIVDEEGNELFTVGYTEGRPSLEPFGVTFGGLTRDNDKFLTYTGNIPSGTTDAKEYVTDKVGVLYENLKKIEDNMTTAVKGVEEARKSIKDSIKVV